MSRRSELEGVVRSWLREDQHEDADRMLDLVLAELDTTPQRRASWLARRFPFMNRTNLLYGLAAAVVLAVALLGIRFLPLPVGNPGASSNPEPSPTVPVGTPIAGYSAAPIPSGLTPLSPSTQLAGGTYLLAEPFELTASIDLPPGWFVNQVSAQFALITADADILDDGVRPAIALWLVDFIPDSCPVAGADPTPQPSVGPTAGDIAAAIIGRPGFAAVQPVPVTLDGYGGVEMELRPALGGLRCSGGYIRSYRAGSMTRQQYPGDISKVTILEVDGRVVLIDRLFASENSDVPTSDAARAELEAIYQSITFAP